MIPGPIESHLRGEPSRVRAPHPPDRDVRAGARGRRARERPPGREAVVVSLDEPLAFAVVAAADRVSLAALEEATDVPRSSCPSPSSRSASSRARPVRSRRSPCSACRSSWMRASSRRRSSSCAGGTHEDAIVLDTGEWMRCEGVTPIAGLGTAMTGHPTSAAERGRACPRLRREDGAPDEAARARDDRVSLPAHGASVYDDLDRRVWMALPQEPRVFLGAIAVPRPAHGRLEPLVRSDERGRARACRSA